MPRCASFPPVAKADARILILGSLPGEESLRQRQYYAKPQNAFWKIMGELVGARTDLPYQQRLQKLMQHHIALWDVCESAHRQGSLDSNIRNPKPNAFKPFFETHTHIEGIFFNGQPAAHLFKRLVLNKPQPAFEKLLRKILPSTSPANARLRQEQKLSVWREALAPFLEIKRLCARMPFPIRWKS